MFKGRIVESGTVDDIMNEPVHPYTKKLFSANPGVSRIDEEQELVFHVEEEGFVDGLPGGYCFHAGSETGALPEMLEINDGHFVACFKI